MVRFITLFAFALLAVAVGLGSSIFSGVAMTVVGLSVIGLLVSLYADFSRDP